MIRYESHFKELRFHVGGTLHKFSNGVFHTDDEKVQAALENVAHARKVEETAQADKKPKRGGKKNTAATEEAAE